MIAWFRVDASAAIGAGHLMRCLALAEALWEQHVECLFLVREPTIPFCKARHDWRWKLIQIPEDIGAESEQEWLQNQCDFSGQDIFVLDGYQFDADYINRLQDFKIPVILFDDNNDRGKMTLQMVINGAANASDLGYQETLGSQETPGSQDSLHREARSEKTTLCIGEKYRLLRSEFRTELPQPLTQRHSIAIIMGGTDTKNLIIPLLMEFQRQQNAMPVRVLVNNNYRHVDALHKAISECDFAVQLVINGPDLANIFNNSKLVISAAGGTQFELLAMHTPAILLSVADNQVNATQQSQQQGWCEHYDCRSDVPFEEIVSRVAELLQQPRLLTAMHDNARIHADGKGTERLLDAIFELSVEG